MPGARLVLLTSGEGGTSTERLSSALASWCRAGLLGAVAWSPAEDLAEQGAGAECGWAEGRDWSEGLLSAAVSGGLSELWLAALRGPARDSGSARQAEEDALEAMSGLFGGGVRVHSLTVTMPGPERPFGRGDFSPMWDFHLVHDRRVTPDPHTASAEASGGDPLALGAAAALCAAGGWSGSADVLDLADRADGPVKDPRIVHTQQRVLHAPNLAFLGIPSSPPWPVPKDAGVRRALPGSVPPVRVAESLASQCGFKCKLAPAAEEVASDPGLRECLFGPLTKPQQRSEAESALRRLAQRTSGFHEPGTDGMVRLNLEGPAGTLRVAELADHIRHSNFPIGPLSAGAEGATPETWRTVRSAFFGLVDGTEMPTGVPPVTSGEGRDGEVLVWSDPSALAPPRLPEMEPSPSPPLSEHSDSGRGPAVPPPPPHGTGDDNTVPAEDEAPPAARGEEPGSAGPPRKTVWEVADGMWDADAGESTGRYRLTGTDMPGPMPEASDGSRSRPPRSGVEVAESPSRSYAAMGSGAAQDTGADSTVSVSALDEWLASDEGALPTGGDHDTLMSRLTANLDSAVGRARRNFERYATLRRRGDEYEQAKRSRKWTLAVLTAFSLLLAAAVAAAVDQRWPYLAVAWEAITPFRARPAYDPAIWPVGWLAAVCAIAAFGAWAFQRRAAGLRDAVHDLREGERQRREHIANSVHYAAELVRLQSLSEQFADHRRIIVEMLHRPFGDPELSRRDRLDIEGLRLEEAPPPSMLVAAADASAERVEAEQRKLRADAARRGWLTSAHHDILEAWRTHYEKRVLEDRPEPDSDASIPGAVVSRDHRDGSEVLGAREDYANAVDADGWAVRDANRARWRRLLAEGDDSRDGMSRYLALLETLSAVHGPAGVAQSAAGFLALGAFGAPLPAEEVRHRFSWSELLSTPAAPQVNAIGAGPDPVAGDADAGTMMLLSWRLEYSDQVRAEDLRGWTAAARRPAAAPSTGGVI